MQDDRKTKQALIAELQLLRGQLEALSSKSAQANLTPDSVIEHPSHAEQRFAILESELRASEERFRLAAQCSSNFIYERNLITGRAQFFGDIDGCLGYGPGEFPRELDGWLGHIHPNDLARVLETIQQQWVHDQPYSHEFRLRRKDGSYADWRDSGILIRDSSGTPIKTIGAALDITKSKQAETALRQSEELYRLLATSTSDVISRHTSDSTYLQVSPSCKTLFGYEPEELLGRTSFDYVHPEDLQRLRDAMRETVTNLGYGTIEYRRMTRTGQYIWVETSGIVVKNRSTDEDAELVCIVRDITKRKLADETLRSSEAKYRTLTRNLPHKVFVKNREGVFVSCNENFAAELSLYPRDVEGKTDFDLFQADLAEKYRADDLEIMESGAPREIEEQHPEGGKIIWVRTIKTPVRDENGGIIGVLGIFWDITEQKQAEEERVRLAMAIDQSEEIIIMTDNEGVVQYVNPAFERQVGYTRSEIVGCSVLLILEENAQTEALDREIVATLERGDVWRGNIITVRKDGTFFTAESTISPLKDAHGNIVNRVSVARDITRELDMEAQLRQAQKMEAVGQLAGGIAHDFNNLMQVILGNVELIQVDQHPDSPLWDKIDEVGKAAERAADLTRQLLAYSRRQVIQPVGMDLNDLVGDVLKMLRRVIGENIELRFLPGTNLGTVLVDKGQIEQVLMNLCVNARDAMPRGGTLTVTTENVVVDEEYCSEHTWAIQGSYVAVGVQDTGQGMDAATRAHIFEPFFSTKGVGKGSGLGLAMVFGIVKQHNGLILVDSELGQGSTFKVYLPIASLAAKEPGRQELPAAVGGNETILIAEDDPPVLDLAATILRNAGYTVFTAGNGNEAVRIFEEHAESIDLAMLDVMMPGMSGREVMDQIKERSDRVPFLFISGYSDNAIHTDYVIDEGLRLLQKPYHRDEILREVRQILDTRTSQKPG